ncbi:PSD1 and planctomycete cytochrome C domain-containing protein [Bythopirellula goksoeyrii]|nr:PSD1 and planctomycete cytochrome C domain-containing protein [Bythopirellula goksoeyrii]
MPSLLVCWGSAFLFIMSCAGTLYANDSNKPTRVSFDRHIRPVLNKHCVACHGGVKQAGDISFVYRDQVLPPNGWVIEPGNPEESILLERVTSQDPDLRMPPPDHGPALSKEDCDLLRQWIAEGAQWQEHWAFRPPQPRFPPKIKNREWILNDVDRFVLARLEAEGLQPSEAASPNLWLRRVSLDLIGLPPTPSEVRSLTDAVKNRGEAAYAAEVDRLLASPHFGERWASVWLDLIRYADSDGLGVDARANVWKYRDWVIEALNSDMPYDEFTIKQLAGDLLPDPGIRDLIATGAHRLTQSNNEAGTDDEEFRIAAVLDRVDTTWQAWQGLTFGCTQCHNHPYDPFRHKEYYQFAAFFNNTADSDLGDHQPAIEVPEDISEYESYESLFQQNANLQNDLWKKDHSFLTYDVAWHPLKLLHAKSNTVTGIEVRENEGISEFIATDALADETEFTLEAPLPEHCDPIAAVRVTISPLHAERAISDSEWGFVLSHVDAELFIPGIETIRKLVFKRVITDEPVPIYDPNESLNPDSKEGFSAPSRIYHSRQAAFVLETQCEVPSGSWLRLRLKNNAISAGFALVPRRGHVEISDDPTLGTLVSDANYDRLEQLKKDLSEFQTTELPIMREIPEHLSRITHVFDRGLFLTKGEQVGPGVPQALPAFDDSEGLNRLALAQWLVSPKNPLTARVAVNRLWARLFGTGLVATEEDFGSSGERPSHPELLDLLALQFQQTHQWSIKKLLRQIVLSNTYRQSATVTRELLEKDPNNRLLARGPRSPLSAEMVRDQALSISGLLSSKLYGPPVQPPIPDGVWTPFDKEEWKTAARGEEDRYRRSIYTYVKRSIPYPMAAVFDAPSREFCTPRRLRSNSPLQALTMLNDEVLVECAESLAGRMDQAGLTLEEQFFYGFELATSRNPTPTELDELVSLYSNSGGDEKRLQALTQVATVLLNLDEIMMK